MPEPADDISARIARLSPAKRALLDRRMGTRGQGAGGPTNATMGPGPWPASFGQRDFWFLQQLDLSSAAFNTTDAVRLRGSLDVEALNRAVQLLVDRHQVLRTGYTVVDSNPMQVVRDGEEVKIPVVDVGPGARGQLPLELRRLIAAERDRPFDLENDVMYRVALFRIGADDHVLVRTTHHIAFDKWSAGVANRELGEIYSALVTGRVPALEDLPFQYADYSVWQRSTVKDDELAEHLDFFTAHIAGAPQVFELPTDHPRTAIHDSPGTRYTETLPADLVAEARSFARQQGATTFMVMLAAFGAMLGRIGEQEQILVGVPVAGRTRPDFEGLIGLFINTVVLRLDLRGRPNFLEMLARVKAASRGATAHQELPVDELIRRASLERRRGRSPLFQVMFDYINTPGGALRLDGLELERIPVGDEKSAFELTLFVIEDGDEMRMTWEYRTDLFERSTIGRFASILQTILRGALANPDRSLASLRMMTADERQAILEAGTGPVRPLLPTPLELFSVHAARNPQQVAIGGEVTYGELSRAALRVAALVQQSGAQPGDRVALLLGRSRRLVEALLGVATAGCVAVLLDPEQPVTRLQTMVEQAGASLVLSAGSNRPDLGAVTIDIESADAVTTGLAITPEVEPSAAMYVVFTSGSTGRPKGVVVSHQSVANFAADVVERYGITPDDRVLQFSSPGFDTMIEEILGALGGGASLVMRPAELFPTMAAFNRYVDDQGVTVLDLPTAWWNTWVDEMARLGTGIPSSVRLVIVGGEAASADRWRTWRRLAGERVRWVNTYGPAEATVVVATFEPSSDWPGPAGATMPIGSPITNARLVVLDENSEPAPIGVAGELAIGGVPVALGYLGGEDGGFTSDPFAAGARLYRTGDLARLLADGNFEYLGRIDHQVKIRGVRVEPTEVEGAIRSHMQVVEAAVVATGEIVDRQLVGHLVVKDGEFDQGALLNHLAGLLPAAMIPSAWVIHDSLPHTVGGKVDLQALRAVEVAPTEAALPGSLSDTEHQLLAIWSSVLDRPAIGVSDDFFAVGGHSLLGVRLIAQVTEAFAVDLPLRAIFEAPTVREMASQIDLRL